MFVVRAGRSDELERGRVRLECGSGLKLKSKVALVLELEEVKVKCQNTLNCQGSGSEGIDPWISRGLSLPEGEGQEYTEMNADFDEETGHLLRLTMDTFAATHPWIDNHREIPTPPRPRISLFSMLWIVRVHSFA
jgi:hypothetical protein